MKARPSALARSCLCMLALGAAGSAVAQAVQPGEATSAAQPAVAAGVAAPVASSGMGEGASAAQGLQSLADQPWNHELRLQVADNLRASGRTSEARTQLEALEGTPLAGQAAQRLSLLEREALVVTVNPSPQASLSSSAQGIVTPSGGMMPLAPFRFVPYVSASSPPPDAEAPKRSPAQQKLYEMSLAGDYYALGTEGLKVMESETLDDDLKFRVANALSWTGRLSDAERVYRQLLTTPRANDARVGLADIQRWQGQAYLAAPIYREVLATEPTHAEATRGLRLSERDLRARTRVTVGGSTDSDDVTRRYAGISHQWREKGGARIWEVEASGVRDTNPTIGVNQPELALRYTALDLPFQPSGEISVDGHSVYASGTVRLGTLPVWVTAGRVNWGRMAVNPLAIDAHLWAWHLGARASFTGVMGSATLRADGYRISDGNSLQTASIRYIPPFRPFGANIKPLVGVDMRNASFNTPRYWSPADGYGLGYVGLIGEWEGDRWNLYASAQYGWRLFGEAGRSWSVSAGGRYWLSEDWALGANVWAMSSVRAQAPYRARSFSVYLEHLWK